MAAVPDTASRWDLTELAGSPLEAQTRLAALLNDCEAFSARIAAGLDQIDFPAAVAELNRLEEEKQTLTMLLDLAEAADSRDEEARDLVACCQDDLAACEALLRRFDLAWSALDDETAQALASAPELAGERKALLARRRYTPYRMNADREQVLIARDPLRDAWQSLHGRILSGIEAEIDDETLTLDELIACNMDPDPARRRAGLDAAYRALEPHADTLAACYDTIVADRLVEDRLRGYPNPLAETHLDNQLDPATVERMLDTVQQHYPLAQRWFRAKATALGVSTLELYDQFAPLGDPRSFDWPETERLTVDLYDAVHPLLGRIVREIADVGHIDPLPRPGKAGGAFCTPISRHVLPYVMLNHTGALQDVMTSAHEFGHAVHFALTLAHQTFLAADTGTAIAEVPSTFGEFLCFDYLHQRESDPQTRAALLFRITEDAFPTVFRQTMMTVFEQRAYQLRADGKALTADRLSELWLEENQRFYGDSVRLPDGYRLGWSYIPHFIHSRFYTYAYSFAHLVALALYGRYQADREGFPARYLDFLAAGASVAPAELLVPLGVDLASPTLWQESFQTLEQMVDQAVALLGEEQ